MAVPSSGQLRLYADIFTEFTSYSQGNNSLHSASIYAGFSTPDAMSDFYGYTDAVAPSVSSQGATSVAITSYTGNGNVTSDGGATVTDRGFYMGTNSASPTNNTKYAVGSGTGTYSRSFTGLSSYSTYYYWAYATNTVGTVYGSRITVTTQVTQPSSFTAHTQFQPTSMPSDSRNRHADQLCGSMVSSLRKYLQWYSPQNGQFNTWTTSTYAGDDADSVFTTISAPSGCNPGRLYHALFGPTTRTYYGGRGYYGVTGTSAQSCSHSSGNSVNMHQHSPAQYKWYWGLFSSDNGWVDGRVNWSDIRLKTNITYL